ncbi:MAG: choline dehydrogenase [Cocleimonas sp.]|jgi:choline dehydrogenase
MNDKQFDYLIVGGGSAGCVLANRLSANPKLSVCLLEVGPTDKSRLIRIPIGIIALMWDPRHNWKYYSEPEPFLNNRKMYTPRGKVLGGSSSINAMCATRGTPEDFDKWEAMGAKNWAWKDLLPHFKATQKQLRPNMPEDFHGDSGEQLVTDPVAVDQLSRDFVDAVVESGIAPRNDDFNGEKLEGAGLYQTYQTGKGERCSAAHAFLNPVKNRKNLTILTKVMVEKVLLDGKEAIGVQCTIKGKKAQILANKEVILSAGSINSPQVLMLSGIGSAEGLKEHNIDVVHDLPGVGKNLSDHLDIILNTRVKNYKGIGISLPYVFKATIDVFKYFINRKGILTTNGAEAGGFIKSDPSLKHPDIQMHFSPSLLERHAIRTIGHGHCLHLCNLQPKSRGWVKLRSSNPKDKVAIQYNYCEDPQDIDKLVTAVKLGRKILAAPSLLKSEKRPYKPKADVQTDEQIKSFIRENAETIYHPVGTCKMGTDKMAVVDTQLRVHGIKKLRVVDASVMPSLNSGNTHSVVIAIANKASEIILSD